MDRETGVHLRMNRVLGYAKALLLGAGLLAGSTQLALAQTAARTGAWNNGTTWVGGRVPGVNGIVVIPGGITVTIPAGTSVLNFTNGEGEVLLSGKLSVAGKLEVAKLDIKSGGVLSTDPSGYVSLMFLFISRGDVINRGNILNQAGLSYDYGRFLNEAGATFENRGTFSTSSSQTFVNRGTVINNAGFEFYSPTENYGTITNSTGRTMSTWRDFRNHAGARLTNNGAFKTHGCCDIINDGAIIHAGSYFQNDGDLINTCTGSVTGTAITGKQPALDCPGGVPVVAPAPAPAPTATQGWAYIGAQTAFNSISAGSSTSIAGTSSRWNDGNHYLLDWAAGFTYGEPKVPMMQTSRAADGTWWGVRSSGAIVRRIGTSWASVPGALKQVSVGSAQHIWGVNSGNDLWRWTGSTWIRIASGTIKYVSAAADGTVWAISTNDAILRWNGSAFSTMPGAAVQVSVGSASNVWVVNATGRVFRWIGSTWEVVDSAGLCKAVAAGADGTVLVIRASDNSVYRRQ